MVIDTVAASRPVALDERAQQALAALERVPGSVFQTIFRIAAASIFWKSGLTKIANWDTTLALFRDEYQVPLLPPELAAYLGTANELLCPVFLILGLATRVAVLPLLGMTAVIQLFVYPENWAEHLTWAGMLLYLLTRGAGPLSLDRLLAARFGKR